MDILRGRRYAFQYLGDEVLVRSERTVACRGAVIELHRPKVSVRRPTTLKRRLTHVVHDGVLGVGVRDRSGSRNASGLGAGRVGESRGSSESVGG
jgi:hypothetical protein